MGGWLGRRRVTLCGSQKLYFLNSIFPLTKRFSFKFLNQLCMFWIKILLSLSMFWFFAPFVVLKCLDLRNSFSTFFKFLLKNLLQIFFFVIFIYVHTKTKMQNSACFLLFMLESNVAITVYNWEKQVFPLLTCFVKLPDSIYFKISTAKQYPKNTASQKKTCEPMTAS